MIQQTFQVNRYLLHHFVQCQEIRNHLNQRPIDGKMRGLVKNKLKKPLDISALQDFKKGKAKDRIKDDPEIPPEVAIGLIEIFAGLLGCIIPFQPVQAIAVGAVIDGIHRLGNGGEKLSDNNHPKAPPGVFLPHNEP